MVERLLSYWEGDFSGAMLNFGGVISNIQQRTWGPLVTADLKHFGPLDKKVASHLTVPTERGNVNFWVIHPD